MTITFFSKSNLILSCSYCSILEPLSTTRLLLLACDQLLGSKWVLLMSAVGRWEKVLLILILLTGNQMVSI